MRFLAIIILGYHIFFIVIEIASNIRSVCVWNFNHQPMAAQRLFGKETAIPLYKHTPQRLVGIENIKHLQCETLQVDLNLLITFTSDSCIIYIILHVYFNQWYQL